MPESCGNEQRAAPPACAHSPDGSRAGLGPGATAGSGHREGSRSGERARGGHGPLSHCAGSEGDGPFGHGEPQRRAGGGLRSGALQCARQRAVTADARGTAVLRSARESAAVQELGRVICPGAARAAARGSRPWVQSWDSRLDFGGGGGGDFSPLLPSASDGSACRQTDGYRRTATRAGGGGAGPYLSPVGSIAPLQESLVHRGADPARQRWGFAGALHAAAEPGGGRRCAEGSGRVGQRNPRGAGGCGAGGAAGTCGAELSARRVAALGRLLPVGAARAALTHAAGASPPVVLGQGKGVSSRGGSAGLQAPEAMRVAILSSSELCAPEPRRRSSPSAGDGERRAVRAASPHHLWLRQLRGGLARLRPAVREERAGAVLPALALGAPWGGLRDRGCLHAAEQLRQVRGGEQSCAAYRAEPTAKLSGDPPEQCEWFR